MCWMCTKIPERKIVKNKPKTVYKILSQENNRFQSPIHMDTTWVIDDIKWVRMDMPIHIHKERYDEYYIHCGIHCLSNIPQNKAFTWWMNNHFLFSCSDDDVVCKCEMPVGTEYYENERGEIVCNQLKVKKILNN